MSDKIEKLLDEAKADERSSVAAAERGFDSSKKAQKAFAYYKTAISDLSLWNKSSTLNTYDLFDENGRKANDKPIGENLFLRIGMPGTGKYDWVKITQITDSPDEFLLTVRPTFDPTDPDADKAETSHFFIGDASNNFCLLQKECNVNFYVIGLKEKQNTDETKNTLETVRNVLTASIGQYFGVQKNEWTSFCRKFLDSYESPSEK